MCSTWPRPSPADRCRSTSSTTPGTTRPSSESLTVVKGIGVWTAEMFLIFVLNRPDILPASDLGVRAGCATATGWPSCPRPRDCHAAGRTLAAVPLHRQLVLWKGDRHSRSPDQRSPSPEARSVQRADPSAGHLHDIRPDLEGRLGDRRLGRAAVPRRRGLARHDDRRRRPARRSGGGTRASMPRGVTSFPASSTPTSTATSCSWPIRSICRPCDRA